MATFNLFYNSQLL